MNDTRQNKKKALDRIIERIDFPKDAVKKIKSAFAGLRPEEYPDDIGAFLDIKTAIPSWRGLKEKLAPDPDNMKILSLMLYALSFTYDNYQKAGIPDEIFNATIGCYNRFLREHYAGYGRWAFDRDWWTHLQIAMTIFRVGELEYEMKRDQNDKFISIHIPSDTVFTMERIKDSLARSRAFFRDYFPEYGDVEYRCRSWLLSPALKKMLPEGSNILAFQSLFDFTGEDCSSSGYIEWIFKRKYEDFRDLPEDTTLQRNLKKYLLAGNVLSVGKGVLKKELLFTGQEK